MGGGTHFLPREVSFGSWVEITGGYSMSYLHYLKSVSQTICIVTIHSPLETGCVSETGSSWIESTN